MNDDNHRQLSHDQIICAIQFFGDYLSKSYSIITNELCKIAQEKKLGIQNECYEEDFEKLGSQKFMLQEIQEEFSVLFESILINRSL